MVRLLHFPSSFFAVADDVADLAILREGCFRYFELGGEAVAGPVSLLSAYVLVPFFHFSSTPPSFNSSHPPFSHNDKEKPLT